jgi:ABC-type nitrate/sulfonate/bicarbonate transport system substrate-binding protein
LATSRSYIKANREVVKSALKAYVEGIHYVFTNKAATVKSLTRYMRTDDQEVLDYSYEHYLKRTPKKPYPTLQGIQNLIDMSAPLVPQAKTAKPEQFVDLSFLQELEREGFFEEIGEAIQIGSHSKRSSGSNRSNRMRVRLRTEFQYGC